VTGFQVSVQRLLWYSGGDYISLNANMYIGDDDSNGGDGGDGIDMMLILIIIGIAATIAILGVIFGRRSRKTLREKEAELEDLRGQREEITEGDITLSKEKHICLVHKGAIEGYSWICPSCGAYYCFRCIEALKDSENVCWSCENPIDPDKPSAISKIKGEDKKKKNLIDLKDEEPETIEEKPEEKEIVPKKAHKDAKPIKPKKDTEETMKK